MAAKVNKCTASLWSEWKDKVKDHEIPDRWSWLPVWETYRELKALPDIGLLDKFCLTDILTCQFCSQVMEVPYTLRCGCSSCTSCCTIEADDVDDYTCLVCSKKFFLNLKVLKVNVVLSNFLNKWFIDCSRALKLSKSGSKAFKNKDLEAALQYFDEAVKLYPDNHAFWKDRAITLYELGRKEQALESIERACSTGSSIHETYHEKGKILYKLGRTWEAAVALMISAVVNKEDAKVMEMLNKVMRDIAIDSCNSEKTSADGSIEELQSFRKESRIDELNSSTTSSSTPLQYVLERVEDELTNLKTKSGNVMHLANELTSDQLEQLASDLECNLCNRLFYEPITTPCGHVFCRDCLRRWLDHNSRCPMCRSSLFEFVAIWKLEVSTLLEKIVKTFFPSEIEQRASARVQEMEEFSKITNDTDDFIPIFVCCIVLPSRPLQLQIFEPRYRLMLRKCLESGGAQFGMCTYDPDIGFADHGTMVEVRSAYFVPDGRALVECWGGRRFKVLSRGVRDGYNIAKVEWIKDAEVPNDQLDRIITLNNDVYSTMKTYIIDFLRQREQDISGLLQFPELGMEKVATRDGPEWIWWLIDYFLNSTEFQLAMIGTGSLEERLGLIQKHLELDQLDQR